MRILITNHRLDGLTGTEIVVRDLALAFQARGNEVMVYSPVISSGGVVNELHVHGVPVFSDVRQISVAPDIIHGQHSQQMIEPLLRFPVVPAIHTCHSPSDPPFYHPRILRYIAVDERCRGSVQANTAIPRGAIGVTLNAVDLQRFKPRAALPVQPRRALVFSNYANRRTHLPAVRKACRAAGLKLDVIGTGAGTATAHPEVVLPDYDIVFAKARCALEAMAVGSAVVLCDFSGLGPMVNAENFERLRLMNFGQGVIREPLTRGAILQRIHMYDVVESRLVRDRVRSGADLEQAATGWLRLYQEVIDEGVRLPHQYEKEMQIVLDQLLLRRSYQRRLEWEREEILRLITKVPGGKGVEHLVRRLIERWAALGGPF